MSDKHESANLILKLYELRREQKLREARDWVNKLKPKTKEDLHAAIKGSDSGKLWMVTGYWEMAAALVNHGAIDASMFADTNYEHLFLFAKLQPYLSEMRKMDESFLAQNEKLIMKMPHANKVLEDLRKMMDSWG